MKQATNSDPAIGLSSELQEDGLGAWGLRYIFAGALFFVAAGAALSSELGFEYNPIVDVFTGVFGASIGAAVAKISGISIFHL